MGKLNHDRTRRSYFTAYLSLLTPNREGALLPNHLTKDMSIIQAKLFMAIERLEILQLPLLRTST